MLAAVSELQSFGVFCSKYHGPRFVLWLGITVIYSYKATGLPQEKYKVEKSVTLVRR